MGFLDRFTPQLLSLLRLVTGLLFLEHGTAKMFHFPPMPMFADPPQLGTTVWIAAILELVGGALMTVGLFTRITAFVLSGEMAVAYFMVHAPQGFFPLLNQGEDAILFCFVFLYLAAAGAGPLSVDAMMRKGRAPTP